MRVVSWHVVALAVVYNLLGTACHLQGVQSTEEPVSEEARRLAKQEKEEHLIQGIRMKFEKMLNLSSPAANATENPTTSQTLQLIHRAGVLPQNPEEIGNANEAIKIRFRVIKQSCDYESSGLIAHNYRSDRRNARILFTKPLPTVGTQHVQTMYLILEKRLFDGETSSTLAGVPICSCLGDRYKRSYNRRKNRRFRGNLFEDYIRQLNSRSRRTATDGAGSSPQPALGEEYLLVRVYRLVRRPNNDRKVMRSAERDSSSVVEIKVRPTYTGVIKIDITEMGLAWVLDARSNVGLELEVVDGDRSIQAGSIFQVQDCQAPSSGAEATTDPYLVMETIHAGLPDARRRRSAALTDCRVQKIKVSLEQLGIQDVLYPKHIHTGVCVGSCQDIKLHVHGRKNKRNSKIKNECQKFLQRSWGCAPSRYSSISILYIEDGIVSYRTLPDFVVEECSCRLR